MAERAEALDIDTLWCSAHIVLPPQVRSGYAMVPDLMHPPTGKRATGNPSPSSATWRQGPPGCGSAPASSCPMHNPFEVAKQVAEVDQLSDGRFTLGVGVGWFEEEFES
ncbi:MAG: hypothetical protein CM1200mP20_06290 [Pseudomonadota bacterium]|nr:MAG: hypothetical protein CM1200mP20_06290 [Pseudomonadota bacterium]